MPLSPPSPRPPQVLPLAPNRLAQAEMRAQTMDRWIDLLAREQGLHRLVYLRTIGSRGLLAREVAKLIAESSTAEGNRLFDADEAAPDGDDLGSRIIRAQWERRRAAWQAEWDAATTYDAEEAAATKAAFELLRAQAAAAAQEQPS